MVMAATLVYHNRQNTVRDSLKPMAAQVGAAPQSKTWHPYVIKGENDVFEMRLFGDLETRTWNIQINHHTYQVITPVFEFFRRRLKLKINGKSHFFRLQYRENFIWTAYSGITRTFEIYSPREWKLAGYMPKVEKASQDNILACPMPGLVV